MGLGLFVLGVGLLSAPGCGDDDDADGNPSAGGAGAAGGNPSGAGRGGANTGGGAGASNGGKPAGTNGGSPGLGGDANALGGTQNPTGGTSSTITAGEAGAPLGGNTQGYGGNADSGGNTDIGGNHFGGGGDEPGVGGAGGQESGRDADPACAAATPTALAGNGTVASPYLICTPAQLKLIGTGAYTTALAYALGDDLALDTLAEPFVTIPEFTGKLDGRARSIAGLTTPLIEQLGTAGEISSLQVSGNVVSDRGMLLRTNNGTVRRVFATGTLRATNHAGLIAGRNAGLIEDCASAGVVAVVEDGARAHIGGLVGRNLSGIIRRCRSTTQVTGVGRTGGLVGTQDAGSIEQSVAIATVKTPDLASTPPGIGGLLGTLFGGTLINCYARSSVMANNAGGLVGNFEYPNTAAKIENSYAASALSGTGTQGLLGGVTGDASLLQITNAYYLDTHSDSYGAPLSAADLGTQGKLVGWDFATVWRIVPATSAYPLLAWEVP